MFTERKTGTPVFPIAFFQTACDSCVGDQPEQSTAVQEKCDSRGFAEIRGWFYLLYPYPVILFPNWIEDNTA
jgi:hypothetical protein